MLTIDNVTKKYGGKTVLDSVTATVKDGRLVAMLGPNGSGKTTLMKMIAGLATPTSGEISIDGIKVSKKTKPMTAYMPTEAFFYPYMTARDAGAYYADFFADFDRDAYEREVARGEIDLTARIQTMSSGMMAKVKLALTLARRARLVMLDEPLNGIDIIAREHTLTAIQAAREADRTIIVCSHLVDELQTMVDDVMFIRRGELVLFGEVKALTQEWGADLVDMYKKIYGEAETDA